MATSPSVGTYQKVAQLISQYQAALKGQAAQQTVFNQEAAQYPGMTVMKGTGSINDQHPGLESQLQSQLEDVTGKKVSLSDLSTILSEPANSSMVKALTSSGVDLPKGATYQDALKAAAGLPPPSSTSDPSTPAPALFNLTAALQPYVQPYENEMDTLLGGKPGQAPTLSQAVQAGMSQLAPYLKGLPAGLANTITSAMKPMMTADAGLPAATNASVQTAGTSGLLTDLIAAAREQVLYGTGLPNQSLAPGALGQLQLAVGQSGNSLTKALSPTGATAVQSTSGPTPSLPGA